MSKRKKKPVAPDRFTGLSPEELAGHVGEVVGTAEAHARPLPGPLGAAFAAAARTVCGITVRAPVAIDFAILQQLDSPLLKQMAEAGKPRELRQETKFTTQDGWNMVYQFTQAPEHVEGWLSHGRKHFEGLARLEVGLKMNPFVVNRIVQVIGELIVESFITALRYSGPSEDGATTKNFPAPSAEQKTGSAGG